MINMETEHLKRISNPLVGLANNNHTLIVEAIAEGEKIVQKIMEMMIIIKIREEELLLHLILEITIIHKNQIKKVKEYQAHLIV